LFISVNGVETRGGDCSLGDTTIQV
jgi:hypothetical protein